MDEVLIKRLGMISKQMKLNTTNCTTIIVIFSNKNLEEIKVNAAKLEKNILIRNCTII